MSNLIVARFDDAHTAFLARAALARLQSELSLPGQDLAVVTRETEGDLALQEAVGVNDRPEMHPTYWRTLLSLLFPPDASKGTVDDASAAKLAAIGIDAQFRSNLAQHVRAEMSAVLVLASGPAIRDKVLGVLRGFQGEIMRTELTGDDREVWRRTLLGSEQMEEMT